MTTPAKAAQEITDRIAKHNFASPGVSREESITFFETIATYCQESADAIKEDIARDKDNTE